MQSKLFSVVMVFFLSLFLFGAQSGFAEDSVRVSQSKPNAEKELQNIALGDHTDRNVTISTQGKIISLETPAGDNGSIWRKSSGGINNSSVTYTGYQKYSSTVTTGEYLPKFSGRSRIDAGGGGGGGGGGTNEYDWGVQGKYKIASVSVIQVPEYVYANASYYVPVKFKINGMGDKVEIYIKYVTVKLTVGSSSNETTCIISQDNGFNEYEEGSSDTYTAWVPSYVLQSISLSNFVSDDVSWQVKVKARPANSKVEYIEMTSDSDTDKSNAGTGKWTKYFMSKAFRVLDLDKSSSSTYKNIYQSDSTTCQDKMKNDGHSKAFYVATDGDYTGSLRTALDYSLSSTQTILANAGIDDKECTGNAATYDMSCKTKLVDDYGASNEEGIQLVNSGTTRSFYFGVSYGGTEIKENGSMGMDLSKKSGSMYVNKPGAALKGTLTIDNGSSSWSGTIIQASCAAAITAASIVLAPEVAAFVGVSTATATLLTSTGGAAASAVTSAIITAVSGPSSDEYGVDGEASIRYYVRRGGADIPLFHIEKSINTAGTHSVPLGIGNAIPGTLNVGETVYIRQFLSCSSLLTTRFWADTLASADVEIDSFNYIGVLISVPASAE